MGHTFSNVAQRYVRSVGTSIPRMGHIWPQGAQQATPKRDGISTPLLQILEYMPRSSWGTNKPQGPITSDLCIFLYRPYFTQPSKLMNHRSNWLKICYRCVRYIYNKLYLEKYITKWLKGVDSCKSHQYLCVNKSKIILTDGFSSLTCFKITSPWSTNNACHRRHSLFFIQ